MRVNVSYWYRNWIHYNKHTFSTDNAIAFETIAILLKHGFNSWCSMENEPQNNPYLQHDIRFRIWRNDCI